ncbi:hypothetical protein [Streptomyces johnsoniae]|uniref:Uncharacterized protein n=1 Tax=Streptomyces johnsoniae TaxID=3075532 RepID=A0ABU2SAP9_9ACTN|nr:hypothetical protein [Streptomyces sp. DSM 41886]MDT0446052.1 hypothetical protein [Streptomyces sp. DSM 41886]
MSETGPPETGSPARDAKHDRSGRETGPPDEEDLGAQLAGLNKRIDEHLKRLAGT